MKSHFPPSLDDHIKPIRLTFDNNILNYIYLPKIVSHNFCKFKFTRHPAPNKPKATVAKPKLTLPIKVKIEEEEEEDDDKDRNSKTNFFDIWGAPSMLLLIIPYRIAYLEINKCTTYVLKPELVFRVCQQSNK